MDLGQLRICFIAGTLGRGGAEQQLFYYLQALKRLGVDLHLLCLTRGEFWEDRIRSLEVPVTWVGEPPFRPVRALRIASQARRHRPTIVQSQHFYTNLYAVVAAKAARALGVGAMRSDALNEISKGSRVLGMPSLLLPRFMIGNSHRGIQNALAFGRSAPRTFFLQNFVDTEQFSPRQGPRREGPLRVMLAGRLEAVKRVDRFLRLISSLLRASSAQIEVVVAGEGSLRDSLECEASAMGLTSELRFLGRVDDLVAVYRDADILVLTSDYEGTPNVILEAMACGLPVISTDVGDAGALVVDRQTGFLFPPDDRQGLSELRQLVEDADLRASFGAAGRARTERLFSLKSLSANLQTIYSQIIDADARGLAP